MNQRKKQHYFYEARRIWQTTANPALVEVPHYDNSMNDGVVESATRFALMRANFERKRNIDAMGGVGTVQPNISQNLDKAIRTNKVGIPSQEQHFRKMLEKIATQGVVATSRLDPLNSAGVSLEVDTPDLTKNLQNLHLEKNGAVQEYIRKKSMPNIAVQKDDIERLKRENGYKLVTVTNGLNQIWNGLMPNAATGQARTPANNSTLWAGVRTPAPGHYSEISMQEAGELRAKLINTPALAGKHNNDLQLLMSLIIEQHIISESTKIINTLLIPEKREANLLTIQSTLRHLEQEEKKAKQLLEAYNGLYPRRFGQEKAKNMQEVALERIQSHIASLQNVQKTLIGYDPSAFVFQKLGYENEIPPKDTHKILHGSLDIVKQTYKYAYETLTRNNQIRANQEALNALLEICVRDGISPLAVLDFFTKLTVYSQSGTSQSATDVLAWIAQSSKGAYSPLSAETQQVLQRVSVVSSTDTLVWNSIEKGVGKSAYQNITYAAEIDKTIALSAQKDFENTTGINLSLVFAKWVQLSADTNNVALQLDQWFDGNGNLKNPAALEAFFRQILPKEGAYALSGFNGFANENDPGKKFFGLARMLHASLQAKQKANASHKNAMDNVEEMKKGMSGSQFIDILSGEASDLIDAVMRGDIQGALPGIALLIGAWKLWNTTAGKKGMLVLGAVLALDAIYEKHTGESLMQKGIDYALGESNEKANNLANMIVKRSSETISAWSKNGNEYDVDFDLMLKAGNVIAKYDAKQVLDWYAQIKKLKADRNAESKTTKEILNDTRCQNLIPKNDGSDNMLAEISQLNSAKSSNDIASEKAAIDFLDFFFAQVQEDHAENQENTLIKQGSAGLQTMSTKGLAFAREYSLRGSNQNEQLAPPQGKKMIQVYNELIPDEVKAKSALQQSQAWADMQALYGDISDNVMTFMEANGIKNPLHYMKDMGSWLSIMGYKVMSAVNNEIVLGDGRSAAWRLVRGTAENTWHWIGGDQKLAWTGENVKEAMEWMKENIKAAGNIVQNAHESWNFFFATDGNMEKQHQAFNINNPYESIKNLGLHTQIRTTYGIDSEKDLEYFIRQTMVSGTPIMKEIQAIAIRRRGRNPNSPKEITNGDVVMFFLSGVAGVGAMAQSLVNTAEVTAGVANAGAIPIATAVAGGTVLNPVLVGGAITGAVIGGTAGGIASLWNGTDGMKAFLQTYSGEKLFQGNVAQYLDGNKVFRDAIKKLSEESIARTSGDIYFTAETMAREGNRIVAELLERPLLVNIQRAPLEKLVKEVNDGAAKMFSQPVLPDRSSTTEKNTKIFVKEAMQRMFADPNSRREFLQILRFGTYTAATEAIPENETTAAISAKPATYVIDNPLPSSAKNITLENFKHLITIKLRDELQKYDWKQ